MKIQYLKKFLFFTLSYLVFFFLARIVFFAFFKDGSYLFKDVLFAFFTGTRLDLSLITIFAGWMFFVVCVSNLGFLNKKIQSITKKMALYYFALLNIVFVSLLIVEFPFYGEYSSKLNHLFFEYFSSPKELMVTVSGMFPLPLFLIALAVVGYFTYRFSVKFFYRFFDFESKENLVSKIISLVLIIALGVVFIRGGFQRRPINWGAAFFSKSNFLNQTALNGIYNLFAEYQIYLEELKKHVRYEDYMSKEEALKRVVEFSHYGKNERNNAFWLKHVKNPNIVLVFMESFSGKYVGALGAKQSLSPNFDKLSKNGVLFTSYYANDTRTSRSLISALSSYPPLPGVNLTKKIQAQQKIPTVATYLGPLGYKNIFFYGGDRHFEDMSGYAINNDFDVFYDFKDFKDAKYKNSIGVYDEELFDNVNSILKTQKKPFFAMIMTLTNHGPFTLPDHFKIRPDLPKEKRTFLYSDWALGQFIKKATKEKYFQNTIFIITADHSSIYSDFNRQRFHIPLLVYSPLLRKTGKDNRLASHMNLPMTILKLCNRKFKNMDTTFWGTSLFENKENGFAYVLDDPYFGLITPDYFYRESLEGESHLFNDKMELVDNSEALTRLSNYSRAVLQTSRHLFFENKVDSDWKSHIQSD
jgi:phosphoglycerol transferase MdoB-like AlkP superfamily enzyme